MVPETIFFLDAPPIWAYGANGVASGRMNVSLRFRTPPGVGVLHRGTVTIQWRLVECFVGWIAPSMQDDLAQGSLIAYINWRPRLRRRSYPTRAILIKYEDYCGWRERESNPRGTPMPNKKAVSRPLRDAANPPGHAGEHRKGCFQHPAKKPNESRDNCRK